MNKNSLIMKINKINLQEKKKKKKNKQKKKKKKKEIN